MSAFFIKQAEKSDLKIILELQYLAYQSEALLCGNFNIPPLTQTLEELEKEFEESLILKTLDPHHTIIASIRAREDKETVFIGKLIVHPLHQGQGLGTQLLLEIEKRFPFKKYSLFTSSQSIRNIRLYEKLGYQIVKKIKTTDLLTFVYLEK